MTNRTYKNEVCREQASLLRGFDKVRGEWSLMALCCNFSRLLSILAIDQFLACLARNCCQIANWLLQMLLFATTVRPQAQLAAPPSALTA
jgi:hypothetical protein